VSKTATCGTQGNRSRVTSMRGDWRDCAAAQGDEPANGGNDFIVDQRRSRNRSPRAQHDDDAEKLAAVPEERNVPVHELHEIESGPVIGQWR